MCAPALSPQRKADTAQIRDNAELAVRNLLKEVAKRQGTNKLYAIDYLDDGTAIELNITIDEEKGSAVFDVRLLVFHLFQPFANGPHSSKALGLR